MLIAIRGAISAEADTPEEIRSAVRELMDEISLRNHLLEKDIVCILLSNTNDIHSLYPAKAVREAGFARAALFSSAEPEIVGALPLCIPSLATLSITTFMESWNDYLWPKLVINDKAQYTLQLALANFSGEYSVDWNSLLAMSVISMIPVLIVFLMFQKHIIGGMTAGGVKG